MDLDLSLGLYTCIQIQKPKVHQEKKISKIKYLLRLEFAARDIPIYKKK